MNLVVMITRAWPSFNSSSADSAKNRGAVSCLACCQVILVFSIVDEVTERLRGLLQGGLGADSEEEGPAPPKVLEEVSLHGVVKHIKKLAASESREH